MFYECFLILYIFLYSIKLFQILIYIIKKIPCKQFKDLQH